MQAAATREPRAWPALVLAAVFLGLGGLFILAPRAGAALFGLPAPEGEAVVIAWLAVVGLRDLVFGLYLVVLALLATPRALGAVLGTTVLIPLGDVLILLIVRGGEVAAGHLLVHLASAGVLAGAAALTLRGGRGG
jgi:hypothetical protein